MVVNATSNSFSKATQKEISQQWGVKIMPAGWAFSIWGIIYLLIATFLAYQTIPPTKTKNRNDSLIYDEIGWLFSANMLSNAVWLGIFGQNSATAFGFSLVDIIILLFTGVVIMRKGLRSPHSRPFEFIVINFGFTLYMGWVSAATILNVAFFLKVSERTL